MTASFAVFVSLGLGYLLGAVPVGAIWVRRVAGRDPRTVVPGLLGVENVFRLLGPGVAAVGFGLDVAKGALVVALLPAAAPAAAAVVVGHVLPPPRTPLARAPRGRGNGVLLGAATAVGLAGGLPWAALVVATSAYAAALARWGYVPVATLLGVGVLAVWPGAPWALGGAWAAITAVRSAPAFARIVDGTEPRLGDPPPVRGVPSGRVRAAFLIHPMTLDDVWQVRSQAWVHLAYRRGWIGEAALRRFLPWLRPQLHGILRGVDLPDGRTLEVALIGGPMLPDQIRGDDEAATRMAIRGARLARELGAEAFGLGAYWSTVGDKGAEVQAAVPDLPVTHGGAYTAATLQASLPALLRRLRDDGVPPERTEAAVVGANGVVAFGVARALAGHVAALRLVGRDGARLERSAATLRRKHPDTEVTASTDVASVRTASLVVVATNAPGYVVRREHVAPGALVVDVGRPADVDPAVAETPGVRLVPGGVVRPPGDSVSDLDLHFGDGAVPACLAETMILAATGARERATTGGPAKAADVAWFLEQGERLGFHIVAADPPPADPPPAGPEGRAS